MRSVSLEELKSYWKQNNLSTMLYIHSAFCKTNCKYCVYKGSVELNSIDWYYNDLLLKEYDKFEETINSNIDYIYFGGGTPNINGSLDHLIPILNKINNLNPIEKIIELHTGWKITEDQIKFLSDNKFTTIILGIQTFNNRILSYYNRYYEYINNIDELIGLIHKYNMNVGIDLMYYPQFGIDHLNSDIEHLNTFINKPDEITIAMLYGNKDEESLKEYRDFLLSNTYLNSFTPEVTPSIEYLYKIRCMRYFNPQLFNKNNFYGFIKYLEETNFPDFKYSILGLGAYQNKNKWTYSKIGDSLNYYSKYENDMINYYITNEFSFYDKCRKLIDWMESTDKNPPIGTKVELMYNNDSLNSKNSKSHFAFNITTNGPSKFINKLNENKNKVDYLL